MKIDATFTQEELKSAKKFCDEQMGIIVLAKGIVGGKPHYAYAAMQPSQYFAFKEAEAKGSYNLKDFGHVLAHGEGTEPPQEIYEDLQRKYGVSHKFENELQNSLKEFLVTFNNSSQ